MISQQEDLKQISIRVPDEVEEIALCGGPYSNFAAVEQFLRETSGMSLRFCLGDIGGFGPSPNRTIEMIQSSNLICLQGNYDYSVGHEQRDCGCGYIDPLDRKFAKLSFDYTFAKTHPKHREWLKNLPGHITLEWRGRRLLLCHGSPTEVNEFVWESETPNSKIGKWLQEFAVDGIAGTHSGIPWSRSLPEGFWFNVGVLGRPAHEGRPHVYYGKIIFPRDMLRPTPKLIPMNYNVQAVVQAMREENLPAEFTEALETGRWTTCFKILPPAELIVRDRRNS